MRRAGAVTRRLRYVTAGLHYDFKSPYLSNRKVIESPCSASTYFLEFIHVPLLGLLDFLASCAIPVRIRGGERKALE